MTLPQREPPGPHESLPEQVALVDLLDRLLSTGVVLAGDIVLSIADIDLVRVSLRALLVSIGEQQPADEDEYLPDRREDA